MGKRLFLALGLVLAAAGGGRLEAWQPCLWSGEKAWRETSGAWLAIVSAERDRLVFLGRAGDPDANLLYTPADRARGDWGGHRFWLGPQREWNVFWPPPPDWEAKPAATVKLKGHDLILTEPHVDATLPVVQRTYAWEGGRLVLGATWSGAWHAWQGIHVVQVPGTATVEVRARDSLGLPRGYALLPLAGRPGLQTQFAESPCVTRGPGGLLTLRRQGTEEKIGVPAGTITVREGADGFRLSSATSTGQTTGSTEDAAVPTQVYAGTDAYPFLEVEQLTPRLRSPASARVVLEPFASR